MKRIWQALITVLFTVKVMFPMTGTIYYHDVKAVHPITSGSSWVLELSDNRVVFVPIMWTIIEEQK